MNKILNLSNYPAEQIVDSINSIWVGEYGNFDRSNFACGIENLLNYILIDEYQESLCLDTIVLEIYCGNKQKAELVRKMMNEKGFGLIERGNRGISTIDDCYVIYISRIS